MDSCNLMICNRYSWSYSVLKEYRTMALDLYLEVHHFITIIPSQRSNLRLVQVQFSHSVVSDSLQPHALQHARLPCPSPTPGACSNSSIELVMPSNHLILCHCLLLLPSIIPSIRVFSKEFFTSGGQSIGVSASASVLPMNVQN